MRNYLILLALTAFLFLNTFLYAQTFSGGSGTQNDPYQIKTKEDMEKWAANYSSFYYSYFKLMNNITDSVRTPILYFIGSFDGNNFTITLAIRDIGNSYPCGLFRRLDGSVSNLTVDGYVRSYNGGYVAGIAGIAGYMARPATIFNCVNLATIYVENNNVCNSDIVSGIANYSNNTKIYNCINLGTIIHDNSMPVGIAYESNGYHCYFYYPRNHPELGGSEYTIQDSINQLTNILSGFDAEKFGVIDCINAGLRICGRGYSGGAVYSVAYKRILDVGSNHNMRIEYKGDCSRQYTYWTGKYIYYTINGVTYQYPEYKDVPGTYYNYDDRKVYAKSNCVTDWQIVSPHRDHRDGIATNNMLGNALSTKLGSNYKYEANLYPRLGNRDVDYVAAAAVIFNVNNTSNSVTKNFKVTTGGKVKWESLNNRVKIDNSGNATLLSYGKDMLVASIGKIKKYIPIQITDSTLSHDSVGLKLDVYSRLDMFEGGGKVTGNGKHKSNSEITISAIPDSGYVFLHWVIPFTDSVVSRESNYTFKITDDLHYVALFGKADRKFNTKSIRLRGERVAIKGRDSITKVDEYSKEPLDEEYKINDTITFTVIPATNQYFRNIDYGCLPFYTPMIEKIYYSHNDSNYYHNYQNDTTFKHIDSFRFKFIVTEEMISYVDMFVRENYLLNLTTEPAGAGIVSQQGCGKYLTTDSVIISATNAKCYAFKHWKEKNGKIVSDTPEYELRMYRNTDLVAVFERVSFSLTVNASQNIAEAGQVMGAGTYGCDSSVASISAIPNDCWHFVHWEDTAGNILPFKQIDVLDLDITSDTTINIVAIFERDSFLVTTTQNIIEAGEATGTGRYTCENAIITATPNTCYHFVRWEDTAGNILPFKQIDTINIQSDSNIVAIFEKDDPILLKTQPDVLTFDEIWANDTETKTITITNPSKYDAVIKDISFSQNQQYFNVITPLPFTIDANSSKTIDISFNSDIAGIYESEVFVDGESEFLCPFNKPFFVSASVPNEEYHIFVHWDSVNNATPGDTISLTATLDSINRQESFKFTDINFKINMDYKLFSPQKLFVIDDNNVEHPINFDFNFAKGINATINSSQNSLIPHKPLLRLEGMALLSNPVASSVFFEPFDIMTNQKYTFNQIEGGLDVKFCDTLRGAIIFMPTYYIDKLNDVIYNSILDIEFSATDKLNLNIEIVDIDGTVVYTENIGLEKGRNSKQIKLNKNVSGKYFIKFSNIFNSTITKNIIIVR